MDKSRSNQPQQQQQQQQQQTLQQPTQQQQSQQQAAAKPSTTSSGGSMSQTTTSLYSVRAMYLGSEPMGELLEGENGSDVIQVPLKRTILRTNGLGKEVELTVTHDSLQASGPQAPRLLKLPIELLAYCGALRQLPPEKIRTREFETLDKSPLVNSLNDEINPPLFVTIFRSLESENTLYCYSFVLRRDEEAMELVKVVMEIYYNLIRINEMDIAGGANENDAGDEIINDDDLDDGKRVDDEENKFDGRGSGGGGGGGGTGNNSTGINNIDKSKSGQSLSNEINGYSKTTSSDYLNELLNLYKKGSANDADLKNKDKSVVSANDILQKSLDPNEYRIVNGNNDKSNEGETIVDESALKELNLLKDEYENVPLNEDEDPIIIKKPNNEEIVYKQNVFIRWLQPPTPPPPAPIIIREVQEPAPEQLPPLVIYKQAPRPVTPPPLIIRERPPSPLCTPTDPLIIERRVTVPERHRKIIIEHLPAPPPKPRDIILEKWLPREAPPPRTVFVQKAITNKMSSSQYQRPVYEVIEHHQHPRRDLYEILDSTCSSRMPAALASKQQYGSQMNTTGHHLHHHHCAVKQQQQQQQHEANMLQLRRSSSNEFYHRAASATLHLNHHHHHHSTMQSPSSGLYSPVPSATAAAATTTTTTTHTVHHHLPVGQASSSVIVPSVVAPSAITPALIECSCSLLGKKSQHATSTSSMSTSSGAPKIAGYRIIRQIIPGPNSKPADIERALAASTTSTSQPPHIYSPPSYDTSFNLNLNNTAPIYSSSTVQQQAAAAQSMASQQLQQQHNIYCSSLNSASTTYCAYPRSMGGSTIHPRPIILQQQQQQASQQQQQQQASNGGTYSPHSNIYSPSSHHSQSQSATSSSTTAPATSGLSSVSTTIAGKARMFGQHLQQGGCNMNSAVASTNCCYIANCCKKRGELYRSSSIDNF